MPLILGSCGEKVLASRKLVCGEARHLADLALVEAEHAVEGQKHFLSTLALANTAVSEWLAAIADISKLVCDLSAVQQRLATTHASFTRGLSSE